MRLQRIISGGQTGVDRGGLDAAIALGIAHGGKCPRGRRAEDGSIPPQYTLQEIESEEYGERTRQNVLDADGTVIFAHGDLEGGTLFTAEVAAMAQKPLLVLDLRRATQHAEQLCTDLCSWLDQHGIQTLNVAGPRESRSPGIQSAVCALLTRALTMARTAPRGGTVA